MKKKPFNVTTIVVICLLIGFSLGCNLGVFLWKKVRAREHVILNYHKIQNGLNQYQVVEILGKPTVIASWTSEYSDCIYTTYNYKSKIFEGKIRFRNDYVYEFDFMETPQGSNLPDYITFLE